MDVLLIAHQRHLVAWTPDHTRPRKFDDGKYLDGSNLFIQSLGRTLVRLQLAVLTLHTVHIGRWYIKNPDMVMDVYT